MGGKSNQSYNRLAVIGGFEFFRHGRVVLRANMRDPIQTDGYRHGRFECFMSMWKHAEPVLRKSLTGGNDNAD